MIKRCIEMTLASLVLAATPGLTAPPRDARDAVERVQDHAEIRQDRRQVTDDRNDLMHLEAVAQRFSAARRSGDTASLERIDRELRGILARESAESRAEFAGDRAELRRSNRPRDDRRDAAVERNSILRRKQMGAQLRELTGDFTPPALERRGALIAELIGLARAEQGQTQRELREDRRERREGLRQRTESQATDI